MSFLTDVRVKKEAEVAALRGGDPRRLSERVGPAAVRDFAAALREREVARTSALIAEVKHRSPSSPQFRQDAPASCVQDRVRRTCGDAVH